MEKITVPQQVYDAFKEIRMEGRYNMFNFSGVRSELEYKATRGGDPEEQYKYHAAVEWMNDHPNDYTKGVANGFESVEEAEVE